MANDIIINLSKINIYHVKIIYNEFNLYLIRHLKILIIPL